MENKEKELTEEQKAQLARIEGWKSKFKKIHGSLNLLRVKDKEGNELLAVCKPINRLILGMASVEAGGDPYKYDEIVLNNTWLDGDDKIKTDEFCFLGACRVTNKLIQVAEASVEEL